MNAANILKPALARGEIRVIGATTLTEYRKHIEKDSALERRFAPVIIEEPTEEESVEILKGLRPFYENFHRVRLTDEVLEGVKERSKLIVDTLTGKKGIKSVTGMGLMLGIDTEKPAGEVIGKCMENGVLVLSAHGKVRLLPALNIPMEQLKTALDVIVTVCGE